MDTKGFPGALVAILLLATMLATSCSTVPVTGRKQINLMSDSELVKMSIVEFEREKRSNKISADPRMNEWVVEVGERIAQLVFWDVPLAEWEYVVFEHSDINAGVLPGGKVMVHTALFDKGIVETKDELAAIIGHEVAHVTARHAHERYSQMGVLKAGSTIAALGTAVATSGMINAAPSFQGSMTSWDQAKESEADRIGILYMARAGYDPNAAISVMQKLAAIYGERAYQPSSTGHPSPGVRLLELQDYLPEALEEYKKAKELGF